MRPGISLEPGDPRPRKGSHTDAPNVPIERHNASATTFFLSRESDPPRPSLDRQDSSQATVSPVSNLQDTIDEVELKNKYSGVLKGSEAEGSRRRSTIKASSNERLRRSSFTSRNDQASRVMDRGLTPSPLPSQDVSLPSTPKSLSSHDPLKSDDETTNDDNNSQAIASSDDGDDYLPAIVQDSQPELIMPSIKMPSRRPFTTRGKRLGRFKILIAGRKGSGKTSLIKSIVQLCEDIVHVDPLSSNSNSLTNSSALPERISRTSSSQAFYEIYASTKPYPEWWSDVDESRILRRRKSMGDSVLERNICFVDTPDASKIDKVVYYLEQQLSKAIGSMNTPGNEFAGLLSGRGGSQVDVILYLISKDHFKNDCDTVRQLAEISNVIPLISKSDLLSAEDHQEMKQEFEAVSSLLPRLPLFVQTNPESNTSPIPPFTVTSANGPDLDTMDASLLMSPEYVQPLLPSELAVVIDQIFEPETVAYLRHTSAKKLMAWHTAHPQLVATPAPSVHSTANSTLASPVATSLSNSGVLIPLGSEFSLNTSNSYALAKVADHSQREERLAQVRLSKWASDLQISLQRERERFERLARGERALWLIERMGEEIRDGQLISVDKSQALIRAGDPRGELYGDKPVYQVHDPLGLLRWQDTMRVRGWIALQVVGSFGVVGGLALLLAKSWGIKTSFHDWAQEWSSTWSGLNE